MARPRKLNRRVALVCGIEQAQHDAIRRIAYEERCSLADVVREAIDEYVRSRKSIFLGRFDPARRAREKRRAREADERALRMGRKSRGQLRAENALLGRFRSEIDFRRIPDLA